jgi:Rieske Fe-S protein
MRYGDYLTGGDVGSIEQIMRGDGGLVRDGLKKVAIYRDDNGALHKMSPICPHLKCIVQWNANEKTWDCPCHGSRFDCRGKVLQAPSIADLSPVE